MILNLHWLKQQHEHHRYFRHFPPSISIYKNALVNNKFPFCIRALELLTVLNSLRILLIVAGIGYSSTGYGIDTASSTTTGGEVAVAVAASATAP